MDLIGLFAIFICVLICTNFKNIKTLIQQILIDLPSFPTFPFIGHFHKFFGLSSEEAFNVTNKFSSNFPDISKLWQFHHLNICVNSPELIEKVLTSKSCLQRPLLLLKFFDIDEGLLSSRYNEWIHDRRFINHYFTPRRIKAYTKSFLKCATFLVDDVIEKHLNEDLDFLPHLERCSVHGVCTTLFGMDYTDRRVDNIYAATSIIFEANSEAFEDGLKNPLKFLQVVHKMTSNYGRVQKAYNNLTDILTKVKFDPDSDDESLLEILLKNENGKFSEKQIRDHILTFLNAGLDTTAAHLNYTILFLAMHQEFQEELYRETKSFFESHDVLEYEELAKLSILDRVMKESFRLAPPIFLIGRETTEDFEIYPGCIIPKNTPIAINTFVLHRRIDIFGPESNKFNPNNFLPDKISQRHPYSFQPFSTGRRNCVGYSFATVFIKVMLASLIRNFKFSTNLKFEDLRYKYGMTLKLTKDHRVSIKRRKVI